MAEFVADPFFADPGKWTLSEYVFIRGGKLVGDMDSANATTGSEPIPNGVWHCTFAIESIGAGTVAPIVGGVLGTARSAPGIYCEDIEVTGPGLTGLRYVDSDAVCTVLSVRSAD